MIDEIYNCDCIEGMRKLPANSIDAIVTDPPYGLSFMGKEWDHGVPGVDFWAEALRVAKPGAHLLAFGGTRTYHRLACAIEDAGWEVRDCLGWLYGSGFPKSMDVSKAIDKSEGVWRGKAGKPVSPNSSMSGQNYEPTEKGSPVTDAAKQWQGWGTALKPAWEPIIMARKPLDGTVAHNVLSYGVGAINIDGCRVGTDEVVQTSAHKTLGDGIKYGKSKPFPAGPKHTGRFPANIIHDGSDEVLAVFPDNRPGATSNSHGSSLGQHCYGKFSHTDKLPGYADNGSASRFFYCAKASKKDRGEDNTHPTVKPQALMRYLINLVTAEGATVLDPFLGSGSTAVAAVATGRHYIGYELSPDYFDMACSRLDEAEDRLTV